MNSMNVALPEPLKEFVREQVSRGGYGSVSEYVRELIRADQQAKARQELEQQVLQGLRSGEGLALNEDDWQAIREEVHSRHAGRSKN